MDQDSGFKLYLLQEQKGKKRVRSARTVALHLSLLKRLRGAVPDLSPLAVMKYLVSLLEQGRKGTYLNDYIDMLHIYGRYLSTDMYEKLTYFPEDSYEKATMSDKEIEDFLSLPPTMTTRYDPRLKKNVSYALGAKRWRVKTMFWKCLAYSGARPGEIAHLTVNTVDFGRQVFLLDGKTGKRIVPIATCILEELREFVSSLSTEDLFPSQRGGMTRQGGVINDVAWGYDFHERLKRLGIKRKNLTPYSLRHSFITRLLNEDLNLYKVQNLVGHKQGSPITSTYYHLTTKALVKTLEKDPLQRTTMTPDERFILFRNSVRQLLSEYCTGHQEESKFLRDLMAHIF